MSSVAVIDYGMGNLHSVAKALEHVSPKTRVFVTAEPNLIRQAGRIVFPGQGAIGDAMLALREQGLLEVLLEVVHEKPFLGICLGLQALLEKSEEDGGTECLGILPGEVLRFPAPSPESGTGTRLKVPHMGWNQVHQMCMHPIWKGIPQDSRFYFVHSYYVKAASDAVVAATTDYGINFVSAAYQHNIVAVQFHPEKSQHAGLSLLENFLQWDGQGG